MRAHTYNQEQLSGWHQNRLSLEPNVIFAKDLSRRNATHLPIGTFEHRLYDPPLTMHDYPAPSQ